jgi:hypothetical protein
LNRSPLLTFVLYFDMNPFEFPANQVDIDGRRALRRTNVGASKRRYEEVGADGFIVHGNMESVRRRLEEEYPEDFPEIHSTPESCEVMWIEADSDENIYGSAVRTGNCTVTTAFHVAIELCAQANRMSVESIVDFNTPFALHLCYANHSEMVYAVFRDIDRTSDLCALELLCERLPIEALFSEWRVRVTHWAYDPITEGSLVTFATDGQLPLSIHVLTDDFYVAPCNPRHLPMDGDSGCPLLFKGRLYGTYVGTDGRHLIFARRRPETDIQAKLYSLGLRNIRLQAKKKRVRVLAAKILSYSTARDDYERQDALADMEEEQIRRDFDDYDTRRDDEDFTVEGKRGRNDDREELDALRNPGKYKVGGAARPFYKPQMFKPAPEFKFGTFGESDEEQETPPPSQPPRPSSPSLSPPELKRAEAVVGRPIGENEYLIENVPLTVKPVPLTQRKKPMGITDEEWEMIIAAQAPKVKVVTFTAPTPDGGLTNREKAELRKREMIEKLRSDIADIEKEGVKLQAVVYLNEDELKGDPAAQEMLLLTKKLKALRIRRGWLKQQADQRAKQEKEATRAQNAITAATAQVAALAKRLEELKLEGADFQ